MLYLLLMRKQCHNPKDLKKPSISTLISGSSFSSLPFSSLTHRNVQRHKLYTLHHYHSYRPQVHNSHPSSHLLSHLFPIFGLAIHVKISLRATHHLLTILTDSLPLPRASNLVRPFSAAQYLTWFPPNSKPHLMSICLIPIRIPVAVTHAMRPISKHILP
jgi:hypothetical protein